MGHLDVVKKLLSCGADPNIPGDGYLVEVSADCCAHLLS